MSQGNKLTFNVSKSGPTTSMTNANTISTASTSSSNDLDINDNENNGSKSQHSQNMSHRAPSVERNGMSFPTGSSISSPKLASAVLTTEDSTNDRVKVGRGQSDLIGLFDKFNVSDKKELVLGPEGYKESDVEGEEGSNSAIVDGDIESKSRDADEVDEDDEGEEIMNEKLDSEEMDRIVTSTIERQVVEKNRAPLMMMQPYTPPLEVAKDEITSVDHGQERDTNDAVTDTNVISGGNSSIGNDSNFMSVANKDRRDCDQPHSLAQPSSIKSSEVRDKSEISDIAVERKIVPTRKNSREMMSGLTNTINSEEQHKQSHKPFDFQNFLVHLKRKSADPIVRYVRSFLVSFSKQGNSFTTEQKQKIIMDFKSFMNDKFLLYEPFASMDDTDLENSREGLEKLIMNRLYEHCFAPEFVAIATDRIPETFAKDIEEDKKFTEQLEKFSWVNATHLDLDLFSKSNDNTLLFPDNAVKELNKINNYRAPRDKIICFLNCCKIIFSFLRTLDRETSADSFMPILILVIIKAKTPQLISNIQYIKRFRSEEWLNHGEISYYLLSLEGTISFISNLSFDDLSIDGEEYSAHMEAWEASTKQRQQTDKTADTLQQPQPQHANSIKQERTQAQAQNLSPSNVLFTSAEMFTKSLSNFLSSPSQDAEETDTSSASDNVAGDTSARGNQPNNTFTNDMNSTYKNLKEIFPTIDSAVLKDVIVMSNGDMDQCVDACLQLVNVV